MFWWYENSLFKVVGWYLSNGINLTWFRRHIWCTQPGTWDVTRPFVLLIFKCRLVHTSTMIYMIWWHDRVTSFRILTRSRKRPTTQPVTLLRVVHELTHGLRHSRVTLTSNWTRSGHTAISLNHTVWALSHGLATQSCDSCFQSFHVYLFWFKLVPDCC